jgi:hypothetical protein
MSYTLEHTKESLSKAYITAVAGMAGVLTGSLDYDYGVDGSLATVERRVNALTNKCRIIKSPYSVDYQLKATTKWKHDPETDEIIYDLESKTYNDIISRANDEESLFLFLLCLPSQKKDWLDISPTNLLLKNCCYWFTTSGNITNNRSRVRIRIPVQNLLTVTAVKNLLANERNRRLRQFS